MHSHTHTHRGKIIPYFLLCSWVLEMLTATASLQVTVWNCCDMTAIDRAYINTHTQIHTRAEGCVCVSVCACLNESVI